MADKSYPNSAALFRNRERKNAKAPHFKCINPGRLVLDRYALEALGLDANGADSIEIPLDIAAWERPTKGGDVWYSLSFKVVDNQQRDRTILRPPDDKDIPF